MTTQQTDFETTRYLYKPNVETSRYFTNNGGEDIAEQVEQNTTDISDLKNRMDTAETNISTNTSNISTNTSNIILIL